MKTQQNNGGPAFPYREEDGQGGYEQHQGMSLRDYFAGKALSGLLAHDKSSSWEAHEVAGDCYGYADAMIKARAAKP
jgi:hypothetical protein